MQLSRTMFSFKQKLLLMSKFQKQIIAIICLTLVGCLYMQQNLLLQSRFYSNSSESSQCIPRSNIVFIKAHKCASSAIQNIFMRYGYFNNKIFVLPPTANYLAHPKHFKANVVPSPDTFNGNYNILTHHSRLNYTEMRSLMPKDSVFVSIIRNPVNLFESMFQYYKLNNSWKIDFNIFNNASDVIPINVIKNRLYGRIGINQMMFDMGFEEKYFYDRNKTIDYIHKLDSIFSLVMVSERMDESLILLKDLLCWSYEDVVVFKVNARNDTHKSEITQVGAIKIQELNSADHLLYQHFSKKFDQQVKQFGEARMEEEIKTLREKRDYYFRFCVDDTYVNTKSKIVRFFNQKKNNLLCKFLTNSELSLTDFIRGEQIRRHPGSVFPALT